MTPKDIQKALADLADPRLAEGAVRFMKTGPGEYGEGDVFRGIRVPELRRLTRACDAWGLDQIDELLSSPFHEDRLLATLVMVRQYGRGDADLKAKLFSLYVRSADRINSWDIVDVSAAQIIGAHLADRDRAILRELAASPVLWERRMAMIATFAFIRKGDFPEALALAELLLRDPEDLMHKAVGWMLREVGKRDLNCELQFLKAHYRKMPRTMLRYAIEKFPESLRQDFLAGRA